ncbi:hypothetical protein H6P81_017716 [Aristolochia fimbriata]|uniref:Fe2OG dioxygenase domain-containing protein n=1 Tax=Aristolochia fimbriata TaxID=158543 RepID=A0AAV7DZG3_ARIFI|nr:hypothetical protein H6P81_017716 [Aristolochia fimbriata]
MAMATSMAMAAASTTTVTNIHETEENQRYKKGVRHLCESGITTLPTKYVLPFADRPNQGPHHHHHHHHRSRTQSSSPAGTNNKNNHNINLPLIDFADFTSTSTPTKRAHALHSLATACEEYGFFQVINHGISPEVVQGMMESSRCFFDLPFEERAKYMSNDMSAPVRYGTSWNQNKDGVFCWRDFLKLTHPTSTSTDRHHHHHHHSSQWPSTPTGFRETAGAYAKETRTLFVKLAEAVLESLGVADGSGESMLRELGEGSQMMVLNCYPSCPEPDLTLGMPPHTDYGFLTLLLQDAVPGLEIQSGGSWLPVQPRPGSFVVNVGDHLEIFSNGRYKSVLHRVRVNSTQSRISVASLHSLPHSSVIGPSPALVNERNPRRYGDTDFAAFLRYLTAGKDRTETFLDSIKLN